MGRTLIAWGALMLSGTAMAQPSDPLAAVAQAVERRDTAGALRLLDALPVTHGRMARARYLRGRLLERLGRHAEAARAFQVDGPGLPAAIAADARMRRALALSHTAACAEATPLLEPLATARTARGALARARLAECQLRLGHAAAAIPMLREVAREDGASVDTFAVRLMVAEALNLSGDQAGAVAELREALVSRPDHPHVGAAVAQLDALGATPSFTREQRMRRAARFSRMRRHAEAVAEIEAAGRPRGTSELPRWLHALGAALYGTRRNYARAARVLAEAARRGARTALDDEFRAARALARADQDGAAVAAFRRFVRAHRHHARAPQAAYLAAWLEIRMGRAAGETHMRQLASSRHAKARPALARKATWQLALRAFERRRYLAAAAGFERYAASGRGAMVRGRGLYWLGRAQAARGDHRAAMGAYRRALRVEPLHWYAQLSRMRLRELGAEPGPPFAARGPAGAARPLVSAALPAEVRFFQGLGLNRDAARALRKHEAAIRSAAPSGRGVEALVMAYRAVGMPGPAYRLVASRTAELSQALNDRNRWVWEAAYPRPFAEELERAAQGADLPPEYLWAIMRQESGYDTAAVSYADAIGALQLLPSTAARIAARLGVPFHRELLFDPGWNVRFAAAYNAALHRRFDGCAPLALAAFNAGGHRVDRWLGSRETDLDLFVERIPFDQTRNYVRRVMTHYARYLYMARPEQSWPLELPRRVAPREGGGRCLP